MTTTQPTEPSGTHAARYVRGTLIALAMTVALGVQVLPVSAQDAVVGDIAAINDQLGLRDSTPFTLNLSGGVAANGVRFQVPIAGALETIELAPYSVRAPGFAVEVQKADGSYEIIDTGPPRTLRGTIVGQPGSVVGGAFTAKGLEAMILLADNTKLWIQPIPASATVGGHIIYANSDVLPTGETCIIAQPIDGGRSSQIASTLEASHEITPASEQPVIGGAAGTVTTFVTELAADADFEYFSNFDDASLVAADIEHLVNFMNMQYERDVQIRHVLTRIIVRTAEPNVYSRVCIGGLSNGVMCSVPADCPGGVCPVEFDPNYLLNTFKNHWDSAQTNVQRDVAQLFTGKDMTGSVIGAAFRGTDTLNTICGTQTARNFGYSVVETNCGGCSTLAFRLDLSAHELGHNWSADHCVCGDGWTMNPGITSANRFHKTFTIPEISAFRDTRTCLDDANELIRLFLTADRISLGETDSVQLAAEADFLNGPNQDVTSGVVWTIDPPNSGSISAAGVFTPANINGARCVTVTATFTSLGIVREAQASFTLYDDQTPLSVASANPQIGAIDARQPTNPDGTNPIGWDVTTITFNGGICSAAPADFSVSTEGGVLTAPQVVAVDAIDGSTYTLRLSGPIEPGAWTDIVHTETGATMRLGYLPGDVNGDGVSGPSDILDLIDSLNNIGPPRRSWSLDLDRSGEASAPDILTVIDLLNGAGGFDPWNGVTLP